MADFVVAIDAGTTGLTALVLDGGCRVRGRAYSEFQQIFPQAGRVEHDASRILVTAKRVARRAVKEAGIQASSVNAIGITNQRETTVLWDRQSGKPVHNAIVWQDRRTAKRCTRLKRAGKEPEVRRKTGLVLDPYFSATKLEWLLRNVGGAKARARRGELAFGTIDSWLAHRLTGEHVTDVTNASRTMLWNIHDSRWDGGLLELFGVPGDVLPEVVPSAHVVGESDILGAPTPVASLVGDQQAALFGQRCLRAGEAKNTYGTGCFLLQHTGTKPVSSRHGLLTTRAAATDNRPRYALEGSVFIGGAAIQWLRDGLRILPSAPQVDQVASDDAHGVVFVPAFAGLGAPHWDPDARGAILGLTQGAGRSELARAALEAIALQSHEVLVAMAKDSGKRATRLRVDGGASQSEGLLQFQADLLQAPVERPDNVETTALGAGMLAGVAVGLWKQSDLEKQTRGHVVRPKMDPGEAARHLRRWQKAIKVVRSFTA